MDVGKFEGREFDEVLAVKIFPSFYVA